MTKRISAFRFLLAACLMLAASVVGSAEAADYTSEYDKKIKADQEIGVLGQDLAGDRVNYGTGGVSFKITDITVPSNGMAISLSRSYDVEPDRAWETVKGTVYPVYNPEIWSLTKRRMGDWDLDVPRISTVMTQSGGWVVNTTTPQARCSVTTQTQNANQLPVGSPPYVQTSWMAFHPATYWSGYTLHAGGQAQSLLSAVAENTTRPATGGPYHWTTNADWWVSCLSTLAGPDIPGSGVPQGEGFIAISPDGTRYTFNWLSKRNTTSVSQQSEPDPTGYGTRHVSYVFRAEYEMLATRIEDRFGNWTQYSWSNDTYPRLNSITTGVAGGAAEQTISITYDSATGFISEAKVIDDGGVERKWQYQYIDGVLYRVILPDTSYWEYYFNEFTFITPVTPYCEYSPMDTNYNYSCYGGGDANLGAYYGYVRHPSGAQIEYWVGNHFQLGSQSGGWAYPTGLLQKVISGPGLTTATWRMDYLPSREQARDACFAPTGCLWRTFTDERGPDGSLVRRMFHANGTQMAQFDGATQSGAGGGTDPLTTTPLWGSYPLSQVSPTTGTVPVFYRETDSEYVDPATAPYLVKVGVNPLANIYYPNNVYPSERRLPLLRQTTYQQGVTFRSEVPASCGSSSTSLCFTEFAQPTRRVATSTGGSTGAAGKTETTSYLNDSNLWVIGLVASKGCLYVDCNGSAGRILSRTEYDSRRQPWKIYGLDQTTPEATLTYHANGSLATAKDARQYTTSLTDYFRGIPRLITFPTNATMSADVGVLGKIRKVFDPLGNPTCYDHDPLGRINKITYTAETGGPACNTANYAETNLPLAWVPTAEFGVAANHWKREVTTGTGKTSTIFDARFNPVVVITEDTANPASKSFVVSRFDGLGRLVFKSYPVATLTSVNDPLLGVRTTYDALGRVTRVQQDSESINGSTLLNTDTAYIGGFRTQVTNPRGHVTTTGYQVFDQPSTDAPVRIEMPEGVATTIQRQATLGKPVRVTRDGPYAGGALGAVRRYLYDADERLCETIEPESAATIVAYDANGNIAWSADGQPSGIDTPAGRTDAQICADDRAAVASASRISRTYDAMNRELTRSTPGGTENITTTYYADGQVNTLTAANPGNAPVTTTYSYNRRRLLTQEVLSINAGAAVWTFAYGYNGNGHLSSQTYPGNLVVGYAPDGLGRPTQAGTFASNVTYYPNGAMSGFTYGNGIVHSMTQNARQLPARSLDSYVSGGITTKVLDDTFSYDANGNVLSLVDASGAATADNRTWGVDPLLPTLYDGLDRLKQVKSANQWGLASYSYDPLDNLRTNQLGATTLTYSYDAGNRLSSLTNGLGSYWSITTDGRGNITANALKAQAYQFDLAHRMNAVTGQESYLYDGHGRRARTLNLQTGTIEYYGYGKDGRLLQDWSNRRGVRNGYVYLGNTVVGLYEVNLTNGTVTPKYQHTDALGSPVVTTNASKTVLSRMSYTPYGLPTLPMDGVGYTGHFMDVGTQLTYMQQRYYDPQMGRFLAVDPARSEFQRYSYARSNPLRFVDPDGRFAKGAGWTADSWKKFDAAQRRAARETGSAAKALRGAMASGGDKLKKEQAKFESKFGAGTATTKNMEAVASVLEAATAALSTRDASTGYVADAVTAGAMGKLDGANESVAVFVFQGSTRMNVNIDHPAFAGPSLTNSVGHDSIHASTDLGDEKVRGVKAIYSGSEEERQAFHQLPLVDPTRAMINADTVYRYSQ